MPGGFTLPMLEVRDLHVSHGRAEVVGGLTFYVDSGEVVTLIGRNGAGKTSTLLGLVGLAAARGTVRYRGEMVRGYPPERLSSMGMTLVPERRELFATLTVEDNLKLGAFARYRRRKADLAADLEDVYALFPRLKERRNQLAGTMSGGEQQMVAIGRALMGKPDLLILDEPSLGLAPLVVERIFGALEELKRRGTTILLVEQNARAALTLADRGYVMEGGQIVLDGSAQSLLRDRRVVESYLGI